MFGLFVVFSFYAQLISDEAGSLSIPNARLICNTKSFPYLLARYGQAAFRIISAFPAPAPGLPRCKKAFASFVSYGNSSNLLHCQRFGILRAFKGHRDSEEQGLRGSGEKEASTRIGSLGKVDQK